MSLVALILGVLATWRMTRALHAEDGPAELLLRFRRLWGTSVVGQALGCFYCLSFWVAVPFAMVLGTSWTETLVLWPALSGGAILLERAIAHPTPIWQEDPAPGETDALLRTEQDSPSDPSGAPEPRRAPEPR